ncbi:arsenate reductase (glutaredoxin) [Xylophilus sp. GW821-FHT01B05]
MNYTIYHNPRCGTSRSVLAALQAAGITPHIVEYLKTPPTRSEIAELGRRAGGGVRGLLREKEAAYAERGLGDLALSDEALLDAIEAEPVLLNRPIVVSPKGVRLCRPAETVQALLPG